MSWIRCASTTRSDLTRSEDSDKEINTMRNNLAKKLAVLAATLRASVAELSSS